MEETDLEHRLEWIIKKVLREESNWGKCLEHHFLLCVLQNSIWHKAFEEQRSLGKAVYRHLG